MAQTNDHEIVSIYPFSEDEVENLMSHAIEAVLMWSTKDGWPHPSFAVSMMSRDLL